MATKGTVGEPVILIIRPENLYADGGGQIALGQAQITGAVFQGAHVRVLARSQAHEQDFVVRLAPSAAIAPGTTLSLSCHAEDLVPVRP